MRPIRKQFLWLFAKVINKLTEKVGGSLVEIYCYPGGGTPHMKGVGMLVGNFELNPKGDRFGRGPSFF